MMMLYPEYLYTLRKPRIGTIILEIIQLLIIINLYIKYHISSFKN